MDIEDIEITLPPSIRVKDLEEFLDDHYPFEYLLKTEGDRVWVVTVSHGRKALETLIPHYWEIDPEKKVFAAAAESVVERMLRGRECGGHLRRASVAEVREWARADAQVLKNG